MNSHFQDTKQNTLFEPVFRSYQFLKCQTVLLFQSPTGLRNTEEMEEKSVVQGHFQKLKQ